MSDSAGMLGGIAFTLNDTAAPTLIASHCLDCGGLTFPRSPVCSACGSETLQDQPQPREGVLYTHTTVHVAAKRWGGPVAFGYVDLATGLRVFTHLEGDNWQAGDRVQLGLVERGLDAGRTQTFAFHHAGEA